MERKERLERGGRPVLGCAQGGRKGHRHPVTISAVHANKYFSYREAWARIKKAQGFGFYLEQLLSKRA
jgi:hypothetical protein